MFNLLNLDLVFQGSYWSIRNPSDSFQLQLEMFLSFFKLGAGTETSRALSTCPRFRESRRTSTRGSAPHTRSFLRTSTDILSSTMNHFHLFCLFHLFPSCHSRVFLIPWIQLPKCQSEPNNICWCEIEGEQ